MSQTKRAPNLYTPGNLTEKELIQGFVVREKEFRKIFTDIQSSSWKSPDQHYIIQGPRGSGKTTLLLRIYYEIKNDKKLSEKGVLPVMFNEEQYHVRRLSKLWESLGEYLEDTEGFGNLQEKFEELFEKGDFDERSFEVIAQALKREKKKLVLFLDNVGDMLNKFTEQECQRFREILLTSPDIRVIGASAVILEHTYDYSKPFFDFFKFTYLKGLSSCESREILLHLSDLFEKPNVREVVEKQPERVETLRRLTGGVLRTLILLFDIFADDDKGDSFRDLETALDRVTPLYKHRMDDLSAQQQEIVDAIAIHWDAISTGEISRKLRMESKAVSAQLKQLEKNRIITQIPTDTKNHLYQIKERFFNIWYLMRCGRKKDKNRVLWLVGFLRSWCSEGELVDRARRHILALSKKDHYPKHAFYMSEALARTGLPMDLQYQVLETTKEFLREKDETLLKELSPSDKELFEESIRNFKNKKYKKCLKNLEKISNKDGFVLFHLGLLYKEGFYDLEKAEKYYLMAADKGHVDAIFNLAILYEKELKDLEKAEKYYLMAVEKGHAGAMNNFAYLYLNQKEEKEKALKLARKAVECEKSPVHIDTLIAALLRSNQPEEALRYAKELFADREYINANSELSQRLLMLLVAKKQYHASLKFFEDKELNLKDKLKPLYYALMSFMKEEYPNEYKKAGEEIKETVEEIIKAINQMAVDYA
jgi:TPR repeat protein/nucleoside-triphosphatase THEP1